MNKVLAMLIAACMVLAMVGPSVMADTATSEAIVNDVATTYDLTIATTLPATPGTSGIFTATLVATDLNGAEDIPTAAQAINWVNEDSAQSALLAEFSATELSRTFVGTGAIPYYQSTNMLVTAVATNPIAPTEVTATVTITEVSGIAVDDILFGVVTIGTGATSTALVTNLGNDDETIASAVPSDMTQVGGSDVIGSEYIVLNTDLALLIVADLSDDDNIEELSFTLTAQPGTLADDYAGTVLVTLA